MAAADGGSDEESDEDNEGDRMTPETLLAALRQSTTARRLFVCPPDEDGYHKPECLENTCSACGSFQLFHEKLAQISSLLPEGALHGEVEEHGDAEMQPEEDEGDEDLDGGNGGDGGDGEGAEGQGFTNDPNMITYDQWRKVDYYMKDGSVKQKWDFVTVTVSLSEYWEDVAKFWYPFLRHHDLSKWCDAEWGNLKTTFKRGQVCLVMDASEAHAHKLRREHQSAYFAMITSTLWVVVLRMHVADMLNIEAEEKERLLKYFEGLKQPAIIRETHYYVTADKEKDQGMVQHILTDISNYLKGRGRWAGVGQCGTCGESLASESGLGAGSGGGGGDGGGALEEGSNTCSTCGGVAQYYEQEHLAASERSERAYYEGHGAGNGDTFTWVKAFSDGCAAQFMCAAFLLFLSTAYTNLGIHFSWNWFCSCHVSVGCGSVCTCGCAHIHIHSHTQGKCDCDPEGGALKTAADAYENKDDPRADQGRSSATQRSLSVLAEST